MEGRRYKGVFTEEQGEDFFYERTGVKKFLWKNREERRNFGDVLHADLYSEGRRLLSIFLVRGLGG